MSDKAELKKLKKEAELAEVSSSPLIGERFPTTYSWGYRLLQVICSLEERVRTLEYHLSNATITKNQYITSDAVIQITVEQELDSDSVIQATTEQTINSDTNVA